uniref:Uncharacterized protein n=1 Tax=Anopheles maculatus TaxID=74869 RepID=A0A182S661_9DIPT
MTSKPQPDKLGRNMKALPSAMWNRAIPENDYIQLGTLRYGVRLSNTGLLDGGKPDHVSDLTEGNSRASVNSSYEITNGDNSVHSVGGTSSISSNGDKQACCCIGSGGVELPWTNSFARTKLPVPSSVAKNRKSSPFASTSVGSTGAEGHHQQQLPSTNKKRHNSREKQQLQQDPPQRQEQAESLIPSAGYQSVRSYRKQPLYERSIGYSTNATLDVRHADGAGSDCRVRGNGQHNAASGPYVRNEFDDANDADVDDDLSALVIVGANGGPAVDTADGGCGGVISSGGAGDYRNGGDDLNLNSKNALRQQHLVPQPSWQVQQQGQGGRKDVNINNFEKKNISSELHGGGVSGPNSTRSISSRSGDGGGVGGGLRNNIRKKHSSSIGSGLGGDLCADELSSTPPLSPRPTSTSPQHATFGCVLTNASPESPVAGSPTNSVQAHPAPIATPFGQRRRVLQPPSSLPVVKSYSFHRVPSDAIGYCSPTIGSRSPVGGIGDCGQQLFDGSPLHSATGRNRSFRSANHARRLQYGYLDVEKPNGFVRDEIGGEALYFRPTVTRKSSLPVLSSASGGSNYSPPAGNFRNHKCSDAINEIRLQSLNKYCNKLLSAATSAPSRAGNDATLPTVIGGGTHGRTQQRPIDELEDLSFIDSSDLSSAGDDNHINTTLLGPEHDDRTDKYGRECRPHRKQYPSVNAGPVHHGTTPAVGTVGDGTLPAVDGGGKTLAAASTGARGGAFPAANRNNYIDSSSDELNSVCSGVEQLTLACDSAEPHRRNSEEQWRSAARPSVVKCRMQCNRNDSNASDDYQAARYCAELRFGSALQSAAAISTLLASLDNGGELGAGSGGRDSGHGDGIGPLEVTVSGGGGRRSDTNNNYHRNNSNGDSEQQQQQNQQQHQQQHQQQQQQQKYTTVSSNNSAEKSVSVGGVGGEPGRPPGGIGEQTPLGRAATDDSYPPSSLYATVKTLGYGSSACSSPDSPSAHHAGLNCFGRSNTQFHAASGGTNDRSIMEKRNNTLDRLQRLVKKTTSSSSDKQNSGGPGNTGGNAATPPGTTKTERLRELTELLKGNRAPPVPPPRRSKHANSVERTLDRRNTALSTSSLNDTSFLHGTESNLPELQLLKAKESRSVDIPYRFGDGSGQRMSTPSSPLAEHKPINIRANVSTSNLEALHELPPPVTSTAVDECKSETGLKDDDELFAKLSRPESRTIVGSYTQKTIPFRSASFSQVDYSSGKYIRSALGALKNSILKSKDQQQVSVDSNTIPRQYCKVVETARSCSPTELCGNQVDREAVGQPDDTDVAKLTIKKTELNINLAPLDDYGRFHDDRIDGKDLSSNRNSDIETIVEDPVAEHNENVENEVGGGVSQQANISV